MSRSKPTVIASHSEGDTVYEVCAADSVYAVLYQGCAIKIRTHNPDLQYQGYKYGRASFPEPGHAVNLARRLNAAHDTDDFTVVMMNPGRSVPIMPPKTKPAP